MSTTTSAAPKIAPTVTDEKLVHLMAAEFGCAPGFNFSRCKFPNFATLDELDPKTLELAGNIASSGFLSASPIGVLIPDAEELKAIAENRVETFEALRKRTKAIEIKVNFSGGEKLQTITLEPGFMTAMYEELYFRKGTPIPVKFGTVWGFRRNEAFFLALCAMRKMQLPITEFGAKAVLCAPQSLAHRMQLCVSENGNRRTGVREITINDIAYAASRLVSKGYNQTSLQHIFGIGWSEVQRIYPLVLAANNPKFANLKLIDRIYNGEIDVSKLNKEELRKLVTPVSTVKEGNRNKRVYGEPCTPEALDEYISDAQANFGKRERGVRWTPGDLKELLGGTSNIFLRHAIFMFLQEKTNDKAKAFFDTVTSEDVSKRMNEFFQNDPALKGLGIPQPAWLS